MELDSELLYKVLLLSCFSHVWLCAIPQTAAHQALPFLGFSRQELWSGLPFPSPMHESEKWKWSRSVCLTLSDPMDCSLPGSSIHGIFQARVLEWGAIVELLLNEGTFCKCLWFKASLKIINKTTNLGLFVVIFVWYLTTLNIFIYKYTLQYIYTGHSGDSWLINTKSNTGTEK